MHCMSRRGPRHLGQTKSPPRNHLSLALLLCFFRANLFLIHPSLIFDPARSKMILPHDATVRAGCFLFEPFSMPFAAVCICFSLSSFPSALLLALVPSTQFAHASRIKRSNSFRAIGFPSGLLLVLKRFLFDRFSYSSWFSTDRERFASFLTKMDEPLLGGLLHFLKRMLQAISNDLFFLECCALSSALVRLLKQCFFRRDAVSSTLSLSSILLPFSKALMPLWSSFLHFCFFNAGKKLLKSLFTVSFLL